MAGRKPGKSGKAGEGASASRPTSRATAHVAAREAIPQLATVDERVSYIAARMSRGDWLGGYPMRLAIAEAWGLSESRVRDLSAEASRLLKLSDDEKDVLRETLAGHVGALVTDASSRKSKITGLPDYSASIKAVELVLKIRQIDIEPAKKVDPSMQGAPLRVELYDDADRWREAQGGGQVSPAAPAVTDVSGDTMPPPDGAPPPTTPPDGGGHVA